MAKGSNELDFEVYFGREKVRVTVPIQADDRPLLVRRLPFPDVKWIREGEFELKRPVINFEVEEEDGSTVEAFDPPIQLTVGLVEDDFEGLEEGENPKLAFWKEGQWILLTFEKHGLVIEGLEARASLQHWGDPGVGVGR